MRDINEIDVPYRETDEYKHNARIAAEQNAVQREWARKPGHTWADVPFDEQLEGADVEELAGHMSWSNKQPEDN